MSFHDFEDSGRNRTRERHKDPFAEFDAREYGMPAVTTRPRHLVNQRKTVAQGAKSAFASRQRLILACVFASLLTAGLSIFVHRTISSFLLQSVSASSAERRRIAIVDPADELMNDDDTPNRISREIKGIDPMRREMSDAEIAAELNDPLALLVLRKNVFPANLQELLTAIDNQNAAPGGLPAQSVFLVGEGSQIQFNAGNQNVVRQLRFIIGRQSPGRDVDLLISVGAGGAPDGFLQVIGWDSLKNAFNYYERAGTATWVWLGDSNHALQDPTRVKGCFQCHVNGTLLMKELALPWNNWHSQSATISPSILAPADALRTDPLFLQALQGGKAAQNLEREIVRPAARRWNTARVQKMIGADGTIRNLPLLLRQLFTTTTVNLASTKTQRSIVTSSTNMLLPLTFFVNREALFDRLRLDPGVPVPRVSGAFYLAAEGNFQLALVDPVANFRQPSDTFFPFLVPEPSLEDLSALQQMLEQKIINQKFAASVLMIDFENPVYSRKREQLFKYVPETGKITGDVSDVADQFVARVKQAAATLPADSPEQQFLANWALPDDQWQTVFAERLRQYLTAVNNKLTTAEGFDAYMQLAISRRHEFKNFSIAQSLAEFDLLLPESNVPLSAPLLEMKPDAAVGPK